MAVIIVEDGTLVAGANSYVSVEYADIYFSSHPFYANNWVDLLSDVKINFLLYAASSLDLSFTFGGYKVSETQAMQFPRQGIVLDERFYLSETTIPENLKKAQCELAMYLTFGNPFQTQQNSSEISELKIDEIQLKFTGTTQSNPLPTSALVLLKGLGSYAFGRRVSRVEVT